MLFLCIYCTPFSLKTTIHIHTIGITTQIRLIYILLPYIINYTLLRSFTLCKSYNFEEGWVESLAPSFKNS